MKSGIKSLALTLFVVLSGFSVVATACQVTGGGCNVNHPTCCDGGCEPDGPESTTGVSSLSPSTGLLVNVPCLFADMSMKDAQLWEFRGACSVANRKRITFLWKAETFES